MALFENRADAGRQLAKKLEALSLPSNAIVLGLPRGGVPVAYEVAAALGVPLDIWLVRKLGVPGHEELAMGAIASGGARVLNWNVIRSLDISDQIIARVEARERPELERREQAYRDDRSKPDFTDKTAILVDDGLATGASMRAALQGLRLQQPAQIIVAVPTAAPQVCAKIEDEVDEIVCAITPEPFMGVGAWYDEFPQISNEEVADFLVRAAQE